MAAAPPGKPSSGSFPAGFMKRIAKLLTYMVNDLLELSTALIAIGTLEAVLITFSTPRDTRFA